MSVLTNWIASCGDLQDLYWNSEYADRIGEYEILERFATLYGLQTSEAESIRDRCPAARLINNLKDENGQQFFNITKRDADGHIAYEVNQLVGYYYTQAICLKYDSCTTDGTTPCTNDGGCSTDGCSSCDSNVDDCGGGEEVCDDSEFCGGAVDCPDDGTCSSDDDSCDTECTDCFGTESTKS